MNVLKKIDIFKDVAFFFIFSFHSFTLSGLNILIVIDFFPHPTRPFVLNQVTGLVDLGHNITIYSTCKGKNSLVPEDIYKYKLLEKIIYKQIPDTSAYDIVYCMFGHLAPIFAERKKIHNEKWKLVTAFHGYDATGVFAENKHIYDQLFKCGDLFLPVSFFFKNCLIKHGCPQEKIYVHHAGIDCDLFKYKIRPKPKNDVYNIVTIGRLDPLKGYEYSISAVAKLIKKNIKINYQIIGIGKLYEKLKNLIQSLKCENYIKLIGLKNQVEVIEILSNAHLFVLSSAMTSQFITEGIPVVLMEAMATGLPVISTDHAGITELVKDRCNGFVVSERNINELAEKIEFLLYHSDLWSSMGYLGRKYVEKEHNIKILNQNLGKLFAELVTKNSKST